MRANLYDVVLNLQNEVQDAINRVDALKGRVDTLEHEVYCLTDVDDETDSITIRKASDITSSVNDIYMDIKDIKTLLQQLLSQIN